ncbi:hypothetical protein [Flavobacterium fluviatile]|uniref:hypothetical protein n=1 Tax=Flavobacterium fluviatile TaxID=1862387 RepID=UPI0013D30F48|nr:hypothetical protein [Flavobacterium fluviatile]
MTSQTTQTVRVIKNYNNWKWDSVYVAKNKFISVAVVPQSAGRILEFNLGDVPSLWVNPKLLGKSFPHSEEVKMSDWRNFGGYRLVPLPIDNCSVDKNGNSAKRWPPPVMIGDSPYNARIVKNKSSEPSEIVVTSGVQQLPVPQFDNQSKAFVYPKSVNEELQYQRSLSIEDNSSLVHVKHTLTNVGTKNVKRGIMISSQHVSRSKPELTDGENFVAYVPFDEKYKLPNGEQFEITGTADSRWNYVNKNRKPLDKNNPEDVKKYYNHGTNWNGEVAPGIYEVAYDYELMSGFHIVSSKGWLCYVNKTNNTAFVKILEPYNPKLEYEDGVNASIFCSGLETGYLETEVRTPLYNLKPGEHFDYYEIQAAAKISAGTVLAVNRIGIITKSLTLSTDSKKITGKYGVFKEGILVLRTTTTNGQTSETVVENNVNPLKAYELDFQLQDKVKGVKLQLYIKDDHNDYHLLDAVTI